MTSSESQPRTRAGREFFHGNAVKGFEDKLLRDILAIEEEAMIRQLERDIHEGPGKSVVIGPVEAEAAQDSRPVNVERLRETMAVWISRFKDRSPQDDQDYGYNHAIDELVRELRTPTPGSERSPLNVCAHPNRHPVYNGYGQDDGYWSCPDCGATNTASLTGARLAAEEPHD